MVGIHQSVIGVWMGWVGGLAAEADRFRSSVLFCEGHIHPTFVVFLVSSLFLLAGHSCQL